MVTYNKLIANGVCVDKDYLSESDITLLYKPHYLVCGQFDLWQQYLKIRGQKDIDALALALGMMPDELTRTADIGMAYQPVIELWLHPALACLYADFLTHGLIE